MMMNTRRGWALCLTLSSLAGAGLIVSNAAFADVKAGVDAWAQGDYARAIREWTPLAQNGDADAQFNMGQAYKLGRGVPVDMNRALEYYRQAATKNHLQAEDNYGLLLFQQNRRIEAMPYLKRSAERGEARAQYLYGIALFNGDLTNKDWPAAYAMMTRASRAGVPQAAASIEQMNQHIPEDQRVKGLSLAEDLARQENAARLAASTGITSPFPAAPAPAPQPVASNRAKAPPPPPITSKPPAKTTITATATSPRPAPKMADAPKAAANGKWRAQLGAFGEAGGAERMWKNLSAKVKALSGYQRYLVKAGTVTRLQAGPLSSRAEAEKLCGQIRAAGGECLPKSL